MGDDANIASSAQESQSTPTPGRTDAPEEPAILSEEGSAALGADFPPDWLLPPGRILQAELDARDLTQAELAARTNLSTKHVNQVIKGAASLTFDMALRLERTLGTPAGFWNRLEANHQDQRAREKAREELSRNLGWLRRFPLPALIERNILSTDDSDVTTLERLLQFFQVADIEAYERTWAEPVAAGFRRAQHTNVDAYATAAWLRLGERLAEQNPCDPYDPVAFAQLLPNLRRLTLLPDQEALTVLRRECATVGVAVVYEPELPGCRACGATRWITPSKALILLSGRYRYHDIFWFTFFHEAAHLILHPKRRIFVDLEAKGDDVDGHEKAANDYAASTLIPDEYADRLTQHTTARRAAELADELGIARGIVAGRLSHLQNNWTRYLRLRRKLDSITPTSAS